jgi:hypothetical protein
VSFREGRRTDRALGEVISSALMVRWLRAIADRNWPPAYRRLQSAPSRNLDGRPCRRTWCNRAERRNRSLEASEPHRMIHGAGAVGERCWQRSQTHNHGVTRRRSASVATGVVAVRLIGEANRQRGRDRALCHRVAGAEQEAPSHDRGHQAAAARSWRRAAPHSGAAQPGR